MEYKVRRISNREIRIDKYTDPKGFFHNTTGPLKVGEIELYNCNGSGGFELYNCTGGGWFEDVLTEEDGTYYMELGCIKGFDLIYRGKAPQISIGDKKNNIPIEDRIKFLYETLSSNYNYNCLGIIYKDTKLGKYKRSLFTIEFGDDDGVVTIYIKDL